MTTAAAAIRRKCQGCQERYEHEPHTATDEAGNVLAWACSAECATAAAEGNRRCPACWATFRPDYTGGRRSKFCDESCREAAKAFRAADRHRRDHGRPTYDEQTAEIERLRAENERLSQRDKYDVTLDDLVEVVRERDTERASRLAAEERADDLTADLAAEREARRAAEARIADQTVEREPKPAEPEPEPVEPAVPMLTLTAGSSAAADRRIAAITTAEEDPHEPRARHDAHEGRSRSHDPSCRRPPLR